ncbi:MAG: hypothetical protein R2831_08655 [Chitinophagaceae bacterium]
MKQLFILLFICLSTQLSFAQNKKGERIESLKIAYLNDKLNLDPATAERFWPIYHQYEAELENLIRERQSNSDKRSVDDILDTEQKALDIKRKYNAIFLKVLSNNQLSTMYSAEKEFRRMVIRRSQQSPRSERPMMNRQQMQQREAIQAPRNSGRNVGTPQQRGLR